MALDLVNVDDAEEPLQLDDVKAQVKLPTNDPDYPENGLIADIVIPAVRQRAEGATRRQVRGPVTYDWTLDGFPCATFIELPKPPLIEVVSVTYRDTGGTLVTLVEGTDYVVSAPKGEKPRRGRIGLVANGTWPATLAQQDAVTIRFRCGYTDEDDRSAVPALLKVAMLMDAATVYANRENLIVGTITAQVPEGSASIYLAYRSLPTQTWPGVN